MPTITLVQLPISFQATKRTQWSDVAEDSTFVFSKQPIKYRKLLTNSEPSDIPKCISPNYSTKEWIEFLSKSFSSETCQFKPKSLSQRPTDTNFSNTFLQSRLTSDDLIIPFDHPKSDEATQSTKVLPLKTFSIRITAQDEDDTQSLFIEIPPKLSTKLSPSLTDKPTPQQLLNKFREDLFLTLHPSRIDLILSSVHLLSNRCNLLKTNGRVPTVPLYKLIPDFHNKKIVPDPLGLCWNIDSSPNKKEFDFLNLWGWDPLIPKSKPRSIRANTTALLMTATENLMMKNQKIVCHLKPRNALGKREPFTRKPSPLCQVRNVEDVIWDQYESVLSSEPSSPTS